MLKFRSMAIDNATLSWYSAETVRGQLKIVETLFVLTSAVACATAFGQDQTEPKPYPPPCNLYRMEAEPLLSFKQRTCMWVDRSLTSGQGAMGAGLAAGYSQLTEKASDRQKGIEGYAERFGTRYAQSVTKGFGEVVFGYLNHEGMRPEIGPWKAREGTSLGGRFVHALMAPLWNYDDDDGVSCKRGKRFALSRVAGALASGFVGMLWTPDRLNTPGRALRRSASAYGAYWGTSMVLEFKGDFFKILRKL